MKNSVSEIRNAAYDAEDIIDTFIQNEETKGFLHRTFKNWINLYQVSNQIQAIQTRIQDISKSRETYGIKNIGEGVRSASQRLQKLRRSSPRVEEQGVVGLKQETDMLVKQLLKKDQRRRMVSILGMAGIGKTTVAKRVFHHKKVVDRFKCLA